MSVTLAASILLAQGACDLAPCDWFDLDTRAWWLSEACGDGPREHPEGEDCLRALAAVWGAETAGTWAVYPTRNGTGCGPGQVVPRTDWGNTRLGRGSTPPCDDLRMPRVGLAWAVTVLRAKALRWRSWRAVFGAYNASPGRDEYADRAVSLYSAGRSVVRDAH